VSEKVGHEISGQRDAKSRGKRRDGKPGNEKRGRWRKLPTLRRNDDSTSKK